MTNSPRKPQDFFKEVWRRQVLQIVVPYAIAGWLLAQVAELVLDAFEMPPWVMQALLVVLLLGFPVVVVLAWIFDITPKGHFVRTEPSEGSDETEHPPAISLEMGDSERRQVTMLSCRFDITRGDSREIDLEYQRDAILALDKVSRDLARRFDAYLIPAITEQFSFVFGYPQAHDDDARRAVAAGLAIMEEVGKLQKTRADLADLEVTAHVGIHTGLVVIDDSEADKQKVTITGQVQSFTDWLRNVAPANTVVISPQTHQLTDSFYETESLGDYPHPRHQEQVAVFRVHKPFPTSDDLWQKQKLVGRDHELLLLEGHWDNVVNGGGQFALIQGKPGIGKSALVRSFSQQVTMRSKVWVMPCYCSPYEQNNAMFPITQALQGPILGFTPSETVQVRFEKLSAFVDEKKLDAEDALSLLSGLLSLPVASESSPPEPPQITRIRTLELLLTLIRSTATQQPVLMIFEDLQWADPTTLEMIEMMVDEGPSPGVFLLFSARPEFAADWSRRSFVLNLDLSPLANSASRELIASSAGAFEMPSELVERIVEETEGNPLYIQELTRGLLESDAARNSFGQGLAGRLEIPATLLDSLAARIDSLGKAKSVLQLCSVLGHEFSYDLLRSVSQSENEVALKEYLAGLVKAEMLFQRDSFRHRSYVFKHILIQESAYNSLLKSTRKELHDKTATVMEERYPEMANLQPARLAYHFTRAGKADKAIAYWTGAAAQSLARFANAEAIEQARQGLGLLEETPVSPQRVEQELPLQGVLGKAFFALHGYSSRRGRRAFERALELCEPIG
ncbi:MAG: AAA family ATPase, partial [Xanthomonadales bacterium]|nr:AAA family ATPase [Xanthomonadales bacterium]